MKRRAMLLSLAALALSAGCGVRVSDGGRRGPGPGPVDPGPDGVSAFVIDAGVGVNLPDASYAVTTNGVEWTLAWTGDAAFRRFEGQIIGAGTLSAVRFSGAYAGDSVDQVEPGRVQFDASTDGAINQSITLRSDSQPVRFDLYIDGQPAIGAVAFSSYNVVSTTDVMPFDLLTADQVQRRGAVVTTARALPKAAAATDALSRGPRFVSAPGATASDNSR